MSVKNSDSTAVFLKAVGNVNPEAERNFAGSNSCIFIHIFLKFLKTLAESNTSLLRYKSLCFITFYFNDSKNYFFMLVIRFRNIFHA